MKGPSSLAPLAEADVGGRWSAPPVLRANDLLAEHPHYR